MRKMLLIVTALLAATALPVAEGRGQTPAGPPLDREAIGGIVRDYLLANPEVLEEALQVLRERREAEELARGRAAIEANDEALTAHPMSPVSGNPDGDITVVEFFDYQCGFCKRALGTMVDLLGSDARVRVVWKEFPILGPVSRVAARAAMAAERQGRYFDFHVRLMTVPGQLTGERILEVAGKAGLDVERLRRDMQDPDIEAYLDETRDLAEKIGIRGTPAFVVGGNLIGGAIDIARMKELLAAARSGG